MILKPNTGRIMVGFDLGSTFSQISYASYDSDQVETVSPVAGTESYQFPTALCKRAQMNQWFYGREALRYAKEEGGILVENLLELAADGETVQIEGTGYDPVALLTLFLKRSLGMLSQIAPSDKIGAFAITCEKLDRKLIQVLDRAAAGLNLKTDNIIYMSHTESFYYYMLRQPEDLRAFQTVLCHYEQDSIKVYRMDCNKRTVPVVAFVKEQEYPFLRLSPLPESEKLRQDRLDRLDREFLTITEDICEGTLISSVYLIGGDFREEWMKESLKYLCKSRRVFQGSNLYSKGACHALQERENPSEAGSSHVFLGEDKLKANIGMKVMRQGEEAYLALLDAGANWFEARSDWEFYLCEGNVIELIITPMIGKNGKLARITLDGWKHSPARVRVQLSMSTENRLAVEVEDLGLGELVAATGHVWKEEITVY